MKVGDPREEDTIVGPLISEAHRERVLGYVEKAVEEGATVAAGGKVPEHLDKGWYVEPTLLTNVSNDMTVAQEEVFGPVIALIPLRGRGGRDPHRQRQPLRAGRLRVHERPGARLRDRPPRPYRHLLGQHVRGRLQLAVRRLQGVRDRARARPDRDRRVPALQDDLGRPVRGAAGSEVVGSVERTPARRLSRPSGPAPRAGQLAAGTRFSSGSTSRPIRRVLTSSMSMPTPRVPM